MASIAASAARPRRPFAGRLPAPVSFALLASMAVTFLAASSAPTPLYSVYQQQWGFSPITTTVIFSVYALSVLGALLTVGSLSDYVGRRPVLLIAIAAQVVALVLFATATGVAELFVARFVQGFSTGAAIGAMGAGMLDFDKLRGATANAVAPMLGTATGSLVSGALVQYLPAPTHLVYYVLLGIFAVQALGVLFLAETVQRRPGATASLRPQFALPPAARRPLLAATPALIACWAMAGFYGSLGPALVHRITGSGNFALGGLALFVLAGSGAAAVLALGPTPPQRSMVIGTASLLVGVGLTILAGDVSSLGFFLAAVVAGAGFGAAFQGAVRTIVPLAPMQERAGVISVIFVVSYLAFGIPAILAGVLVVETGDIMTTSQIYGGVVMVLTAAALLMLLRTLRAQQLASAAAAAEAPRVVGARVAA